MEKLKTVDIKGKDYVEVNERIRYFRDIYSDTGCIITELISDENGVCKFKASVIIDDVVRATGYAYEKEGSSFINKTSYIENCETSAVGRALGIMGIGIQKSIASKEEVENAKLQQKDKKLEQDIKKTSSKKIDADKLAALQDLIMNKGKTVQEVCEKGGIKSLSDLTLDRYSKLILWLEGGK